MKNKKLHFVYIIVLFFVQYSITGQFGKEAPRLWGYGFYLDDITLLAFYAIEFITFSFIVSFQAEHYFRQDGVASLIRYAARKKIYLIVVAHSMIALLSYKVISFFIYASICLLRFGDVQINKLVLAFVMNTLISAILTIVQINVEIRFDPRISILITNSVYLLSIVLGSVFYQIAKNTGISFWTVINRLLIYNYLYLARTDELKINIVTVLACFILVLFLIILISMWRIQKVDIIDKEN